MEECLTLPVARTLNNTASIVSRRFFTRLPGGQSFNMRALVFAIVACGVFAACLHYAACFAARA
jgi:hypothetical protein